MITKKTKKSRCKRLAALAVSGLLLASYFAPSLQAVRPRAWETSPATENADPVYGNERVETSDYGNLPMTENGKLSYAYGADSVKNGSFSGMIDVPDAELSDNLAAAGGTYESALTLTKEVGDSAANAVAGTWGNHGWADGYAQIGYDGDNAVLKLINGGPAWSHSLTNFTPKGKGKYTVSFDYRNVTGKFNVYCALGKLGTGGAADTWTEIREYGHTDANLVSAPGWQNLDAGTPIEGKEGWYRYSHTYDVEFDGADLFRVWAYVGADAKGAFLFDNLEITYAEETENIVEGGGTFEGVLSSSAAAGTSASAAVAGAWTNPLWAADSPATIAAADGNAALRLAYTAGGWSHAMHNFEGKGAGDYLLEFDYYNPTGNANAYVSLINDTLEANTGNRYGAVNEVNVFSAPGWLNFEAGTPLEGREGWYRFSRTVRTTRDDFNAVHFWSWTNNDANNEVFIDNLSVRYHISEEYVVSDNLIAGGGTFEGVLAEGQTQAALGDSYANTVAGAWSNHEWKTDSYGSVVEDNGNAVVKLAYTTGTGFAHALFNFQNKGAGRYLVEFDYYHNTPAVNAYANFGTRTADTWLDQTYDEMALTDPAELNLFSAAGWKKLDAGTPIEGKEGWYHFSEFIDTAEESWELLRIWVWTNNNADNYLLADNVSVRKVTPLSETVSYTLRENDPSGWNTTGTGVVSKVEDSFALTITSEQEAVTTKVVHQRAGTYLLELKYRAEVGSTLFAEIGGARYDLFAAAATDSGGYKKIALKLDAEEAFEMLRLVSKGTVTVDDVALRRMEVEYNVENSVLEVPVYDETNLVVGGGTYDAYPMGEEGAAVVKGSASQAIAGVWSNGDWPDSPATIVKDGDNAYVKVGYVTGKGGFAHVIQTFENKGANNYLVEFDYFASGKTDNCHVALNDATFPEGYSAPVIGKGKAIEGKEGWYHFKTVIRASSGSVCYLRLWYNTASSADNYILLDNVSVKVQSGMTIEGTGEYVVPYEAPAVPAYIWSFETDTPASIVREDDNAVLQMKGVNYSSFFYGFDFERSGVYAFSFDFKPEGKTDNIGFRINPVEEKYTFDVPLLQYRAQWEESGLGGGWYRFVYYIRIDDEVAYKDASFQFWCHSANKATLTVDNVSVRRLVGASVTGDPVWGGERIADGGFEKLLGERESYTVPNVMSDAYVAVSGIWTTAGDHAATVVVKDDLYAARLAGAEGHSSVNHTVSLQNEGLYRVEIRYAVSEGYASRTGASLTYAFNGREAEDILSSAAADEGGYKIFTQFVKMTAEEADAISSIAVRFACKDGYEAYIDYVSVKKEIGSDIPKEEAPDEDVTDKVRYDIVSGGNFEGYEEGASFGEQVTKDMFGTTSLDMPAKVVTNDKDTLNPSKVLLLRQQEGSKKDFSSAFNLYTSNVELEKGRTYYVSFEYKYHIEEPLDTEIVVSDGRRFTMDTGFTFCFVGGTNIGHHEIYLGSVEDGDMTAGANNQKCKISKTDLGDGWARIGFSFIANTGLSVACNSMRFLLLTNGNPDNYAMFDNVQFYTYYEDTETPPTPTPPDSTGDSQSGSEGETPKPSGCKAGCGSVGAGSAAVLSGLFVLAIFFIVRKGKGRREIK